MIVVAAERLRGLCREVFRAVGVPEENAVLVAATLVGSNLVGYDTHGVREVPRYVQFIRDGYLDPAARPQVLRETATSALVSGRWALGEVAGRFATLLALEKARAGGVGVVALVQCYTLGRLGHYAALAAERGMIALVAAGGFGDEAPTAAPHGGVAPVLGTNPLAIGIPTGEEAPLVVDFATTAIATGKVYLARDRGEPLPPGCVLDRRGRPTTDPQAFLDGGMHLPFAGHKGFGLALVVEFLARVATGAGELAEPGRGGPVFGRAGHFLLAFDPTTFGPRGAYLDAAAATLRRVRETPPAPGVERVTTPGEHSAAVRARRLREGIPVPEATWDALRRTAVAVGLADPGVP